MHPSGSPAPRRHGSSAGDLTMDVSAASHRAEKLPALDHVFAAREYLPRIALHLEAFEDRVGGVHILGRCLNRILCLRVPDHNIRIGTSSQCTLPRSEEHTSEL